MKLDDLKWAVAELARAALGRQALRTSLNGAAGGSGVQAGGDQGDKARRGKEGHKKEIQQICQARR